MRFYTIIPDSELARYVCRPSVFCMDKQKIVKTLELFVDLGYNPPSKKSYCFYLDIPEKNVLTYKKIQEAKESNALLWTVAEAAATQVAKEFFSRERLEKEVVKALLLSGGGMHKLFYRYEGGEFTTFESFLRACERFERYWMWYLRSKYKQSFNVFPFAGSHDFFLSYKAYKLKHMMKNGNRLVLMRKEER